MQILVLKTTLAGAYNGQKIPQVPQVPQQRPVDHDADHRGQALAQAVRESAGDYIAVHHLAYEVATLDEVARAREQLRAMNARSDLNSRRRAGVQIAVEFRDPDGHRLEI